MKTKIIATIMALGMVLTAFSFFAAAGVAQTGLSRVAPNPDGTRADTGASAPNGIGYFWEAQEAFALTQTVATFGVANPWVAVEGPGTWTYNVAYTQLSADFGTIWDAWAAGEYTVKVYEVFNDRSTTGRNYTCIFEATLLAANTNWGTYATTPTARMEPIPNPTIQSEDEGTSTCVIAIPAMTNGFEFASLFDGYGVYKSTTGPITGSNPGVYLGDAVLGATWTYTDTAYTADSWYAVKVKWDGGSSAFIAPLYSYGKSQYLYVDWNFGPPPNNVPAAANVLSAPNPHNGNIASEQVTITATITDADAADTLTAQYRVDGGAWQNFAQTGLSPLAVSAVYAFPNGFTEGSHSVEVRGNDTKAWSANAAGSIVVTDTTAPSLSTNTVPGTTIYATSPAFFSIGYGDFRPYQTAVAGSYFRYRVNNGTWNNFAWTNASFAWGSYTNFLTYTIPGNTFAVGDWVDYSGQVRDTAATPNTAAWAGGSFQVLAAPPGVQDPFVVYGRLYLYNGVGGVYTPLLSTGGGIVTATWISNFNGATLTRTDTVNALGQYSIDLLNYTDGAFVMLTATFDAPYLNTGANYTTITAATGSVEHNVVCGIPYNVEITAPLTGATVMPGANVPTTVVIYDYTGLVARGYYTHVDPAMAWRSGDPLFVGPVPYVFNGIADAGTHNANVQFFTGGVQWLNVSEHVADWYPTPWNNFMRPTGFVGGVLQFANGWLDDWDNITVTVQVGGFDWHVVAGWNLVSVPQSPVEKGLNGVFDAYDALHNYVMWQIPTATDLAIAMRTGPSAYNVFDLTGIEAGAFPMDGVTGYWIYSNVAAAAAVHFNATNYTFGLGLNTVNAVAGWNLLGFTHNYTAWVNTPNAIEFTDGTIDTDLNIAGALTKIVATEWLEDAAPQWYHSYVVTDTFPGMATHNWAWDMTYSTQPGNAYFLWLSAGATITFNVNQ